MDMDNIMLCVIMCVHVVTGLGATREAKRLLILNSRLRSELLHLSVQNSENLNVFNDRRIEKRLDYLIATDTSLHTIAGYVIINLLCVFVILMIVL
jgi:hypothetical protein